LRTPSEISYLSSIATAINKQLTSGYDTFSNQNYEQYMGMYQMNYPYNMNYNYGQVNYNYNPMTPQMGQVSQQQTYQQNAYDYSYTPDTNYGTSSDSTQQQQQLQNTPQQNQPEGTPNLNPPSQLNYNVNSSNYPYPYPYQYQYDPNYAYSYQQQQQNLQYQQQYLNQNQIVGNNIVKENVTNITSNENSTNSSTSNLGAKIKVELENKNNP